MLQKLSEKNNFTALQKQRSGNMEYVRLNTYLEVKLLLLIGVYIFIITSHSVCLIDISFFLILGCLTYQQHKANNVNAMSTPSVYSEHVAFVDFERYIK